MHQKDCVSSTDDRTISQLLSDLRQSVARVTSLALNNPEEAEAKALSQFATFISNLAPILIHLEQNESTHTAPIEKAIKSLETEIIRATNLIECSNSEISARQIEDATHDVGRWLGVVLLTSHDVSGEINDMICALHKEMISAKFDFGASKDNNEDAGNDNDYDNDDDDNSTDATELTPSLEAGSVERITLDADDVAIQLKNGNDEELSLALLELRGLLREKSVQNDWINYRGIVSILLNRLGSSTHDNRLTIILTLKSLAAENDENREKMSDVGALSIVVRSLARDAEESREAAGLLLTLSEIPRVRQRLGRIQGCIVMLVSMLKGDDPCSSHDAGKLLNALSGNTQNALLMAEAGYFKPLVQYLKKGSDMNKILMAATLSKMELTEQSRTALGNEGSIEALVKMFNSGKLEAKLSALGALQNLSTSTENVERVINSGIVAHLLQLLFSVTSVLMTLREPASAILASIAQSKSILTNEDMVQQMLSLLNLSSPVIQFHLLRALNSMAGHPSASKVRAKMKESGAVQLLLPFLTEDNADIRTVALNLLFNLSKDYLVGELTEHLGEAYLNVVKNIILVSTSENEKAAAVGLISNIPVSDKKATELLNRMHLLPILISLLGESTATLTPTSRWLLESIAGVLVRFTVPWDKKLQRQSAERGVIPWLVRLLSIGSPIAKSRAATSLAQLSQNSLSLSKAKGSRWLCVPPSSDTFCEVHNGHCFVKSTFCLVKAQAISPLVLVLEGKEREADEAVLNALATLMHDDTWENGSNAVAKAGGVQAMLGILEVGNVKSQEKAVWMLERIFRVATHREQYSEAAQVLLISLAQKGAPTLKSTIAKILAHLQLLQMQSTYF